MPHRMTYNEFRRKYLPDTVLREERAKETPEETGRRWAHELLADLDRRLQKLQRRTRRRIRA